MCRLARPARSLRLVARQVESSGVSAANSSTVLYPTVGIPLWGWLAQVQIRRKSHVDDGPD
jgi:hypothetical protein